MFVYFWQAIFHNDVRYRDLLNNMKIYGVSLSCIYTCLVHFDNCMALIKIFHELCPMLATFSHHSERHIGSLTRRKTFYSMKSFMSSETVFHKKEKTKFPQFSLWMKCFEILRSLLIVMTDKFHASYSMIEIYKSQKR